MPGKIGTCCHKDEGYSEVLKVRGMVTVGGFSGAFEELEASPREGGSILEDQPGEGMRKGVTVKGGISGIIPINY